MKRAITLLLILSIVGCAKPILRQPAFNSVKKMAIVSIYTNKDIYNVKEAQSNASMMDKLKAAIGTEAGLEDAHVQLSTTALITYATQLGKLDHWAVVPTAEVIENEAYKSFVAETSGGALVRAASANCVTPPGMPCIPFSSVVGEKGKKILGGEDPKLKVQARLAQLANDLGVDGVAVIEVDVAYKTGALSGLKGTGLLSGIRGRATPSVSSAMVVLTRDGNIAVQTPHITRGGGKRHESDSAPMLLKGKVDLTGDDGAKSIGIIDTAFILNAEALKTTIQEELAGG